MGDRLELMVEMMRDIRADIKDLENNVNKLSRQVAEHSSTHEDLKEVEAKVEDLEKFRSKAKGFGTAVTAINAAVLGYFNMRG